MVVVLAVSPSRSVQRSSHLEWPDRRQPLRLLSGFAAQGLTLVSHYMKSLFSLFILMNILTSCKHGDAPVALVKDLPQQQFSNVAYGSDSLQVIDVYLPANRSADSTPSLILIHGGGWNSGNKADFAGYMDSFKTRLPEYAIFNINYRLVGNGNLFPAQENDVKAAVDFIAANAGKYAVNKERFVLLGVSAGAHLALLQAYKQKAPKVRAVVDYFGPTDLTAMYQKPWHPLVPLALQMITGTTPAADADLFKASSPIEFASADAPPTLLLHGDRDQVVDVSQSKLLAAKLKAVAVPYELKVYSGERHGRWYGSAQVNSFDAIEAFLRKYV